MVGNGLEAAIVGGPQDARDANPQNIIMLDASEIRPSRNVSKCTRITSLEDEIISKVSDACEMSKSTLIRMAIIYTLEYLLRDYRDHADNNHALASLFSAYDDEVKARLDECRNIILSLDLFPLEKGIEKGTG